MSAITRSSAFCAQAKRFSFVRFLGRLRHAKAPRLDLETLSDQLLRDLGFADGRSAPPRDRFLD